MRNQSIPPTEIETALFNYDQALARQAERIRLALDVLYGATFRSEEEILAAANTLITYGDAVEVQRASMALQALRLRIALRPQDQLPGWREVFTLQAFLWGMVILGGMYIIAGVFAAIVKANL